MRQRSLLYTLGSLMTERELDREADSDYQTQIDGMRALEAAYPVIPRLDESALPARHIGELKAAWRVRQLKALRAHIDGVVELLERSTWSARTPGNGIS
jgi:hypothetical protein